jgi:hypothetical protein
VDTRRATDEMRSRVRCQLTVASARAFHHMREAAGRLQAPGPSREKLQARIPTAGDRCGLVLQSAQRPNLPSAVDRVDSRGEEPKSQTWTSTTGTRMALPRRGFVKSVILPQARQYVHGPAIPQVLRIGTEAGISFTRDLATFPLKIPYASSLFSWERCVASC